MTRWVLVACQDCEKESIVKAELKDNVPQFEFERPIEQLTCPYCGKTDTLYPTHFPEVTV